MAENPTVPDGPDTELAAIATELDDLHIEACSVAIRSEGSLIADAEELRDDVASIRDRLRAVLARPAAGRDLTDVEDGPTLNSELGVPPRATARIAQARADQAEGYGSTTSTVEGLLRELDRRGSELVRLRTALARPAVARTDGQCTCGDPSAADLVHHTEAPCRTVEELRTGRTDGQPHPDPHGRYDVPDAYDHPGWPLVSRIVAIATDTAPTMPNETDGVDNAVTGLLADQSWRDHVAMADVMGLVGDWGTDDVVQAVTDALHEYPRLRALVARTDGQPRTGADLADQRRRERETGTGPFRDDPLSTVERMGAAPADDTVRLGPAPIEWGELFTGVLDDLISKVIRDVGDLELLRNRAAVELGKIVVERAVTGPRPADDTVAAADGRPPADPEDGPWAALVRELKVHADQIAAGDFSGLPTTDYQHGLVDGYRGAAGWVRQVLIQQSEAAAPADDTAVQGWGDVESADFIERARAATAVGSFTAQFDHVYDPSGDFVCESVDHSTAVRIAAALSGAPAHDTAAPDLPTLRCDRCDATAGLGYPPMGEPFVYFVRPGLCHPCLLADNGQPVRDSQGHES
ncbi:hypothetical protein ABT341_00325 [Pseudonocardia alni]|uniref:hypothetical protein n=1 Tax=Pseudonocardia alni TaxID=33907 RepID=UPI0033266053